MAAIETFRLAKSYKVGFWRQREREALSPLTLSVLEGEVFGYLGPNGAGKTTTLKLLMGLMPRQERRPSWGVPWTILR
jgi:ABC-2 type transport system ATP-binding protein